MALLCSSCSAPIDEPSIRPSGVALCLQCHAVVRLEQLQGEWRVVPQPVAPESIEVSIDEAPGSAGEGYRSASRTSGRFEATHRWSRGPELFFLGFFVLFWDGFLVLWYGALLTNKAHASLGSVLAPVLHVAVGVALTWFVLAKLVNRTQISVKEGIFRCRSGPIRIPTHRQQVLDLGSLKNFSAALSVGRSRQREGQAKWEVLAEKKEGGEVVVLRALSAEEARFLSERLDRQLIESA